jgi:hypothetical protein
MAQFSSVSLLLLLAFSTLLLPCEVTASQAVFSRDAGLVYLLRENSSRLIEIDIAASACHQIDLSTEIKTQIHDLALSNSGFILCAAGDAIWSYNAASGKCTKVCSSPKDTQFQAIAYDTKSGAILAAGPSKAHDSDSSDWSAFYISKSSGELDQVSSRYGTTIGCPTFGVDGTLYFVDNGDLWAGAIGEKNGSDPFRSLIAYRCAPMASLIEENTSPASTGLDDLAVTRRFVYSNDARMGGSGWGSLIRFPRPSASIEGTGDDASIPVQTPAWNMLAKLFSSIEDVNDSPVDYLCASPDGRHIFFADPFRSDKISLIEDDGKPKQAEIKGLSKLVQ